MEEKLTFEDNMEKLGKIVSELEKGDIPLEKAVAVWRGRKTLSSLQKTARRSSDKNYGGRRNSSVVKDYD